jgi:predicted RNase H-like nuclease (RuvC/YqgF family)
MFKIIYEDEEMKNENESLGKFKEVETKEFETLAEAQKEFDKFTKGEFWIDRGVSSNKTLYRKIATLYNEKEEPIDA